MLTCLLFIDLYNTQYILILLVANRKSKSKYLQDKQISVLLFKKINCGKNFEIICKSGSDFSVFLLLDNITCSTIFRFDTELALTSSELRRGGKLMNYCMQG